MMIRKYRAEMEKGCRDFLAGNPDSNYCHDPAWLSVIREVYGKEAFTLVWQDGEGGPVRGLAPAAFLESLFGRNLVSLPYLDYGGILAESPGISKAILAELISLAREKKVKLEIRSRDPIADLPAPSNEKVGMILPLRKDGSDAYWKSLDAKVRNQVRKAEKSQVKVEWGREELLADFYRVFCVNMRDLGSPVHDIRLFSSVLVHFPGAQIGTAYREGRCIGGLFRILWKDSLVIPWASTLREERIHSPNNALYWESIRFAFESKCALVDFGRSSKDEGTYKFKKQWLAEERPLYWYPFDGEGRPLEAVTHMASGKLQLAQKVWMRLPLSVANALGPKVRGSIPA